MVTLSKQRNSKEPINNTNDCFFKLIVLLRRDILFKAGEQRLDTSSHPPISRKRRYFELVCR